MSRDGSSVLKGIPMGREGGPGFFNDKELVRKGYERWVATNTIPSKAETEAIDPHWEYDLKMAAAIVDYVQRMNTDPLTGGVMNVG